MPPAPRFQALVADAKTRIREIAPVDVDRHRKSGTLLIDVREAEDFAQGHAEGAVHLSRGVLELKIEERVPDASTPIICYCGGGSRSALAVDSLQKMGYTDVQSMTGGFKSWKELGLPTA